MSRRICKNYKISRNYVDIHCSIKATCFSLIQATCFSLSQSQASQGMECKNKGGSVCSLSLAKLSLRPRIIRGIIPQIGPV